MGKFLYHICVSHKNLFFVLLVIRQHLLKMNLHKYFFEYKSKFPFLPFIDVEKQFFIMRNKLLGQPTPRQSQVAMSAATADIDNDQTDEQPVRTYQNPQRRPTIKKTIMEINSLFITHMRSVLNHVNETCIVSMKMFLKIHQPCTSNLLLVTGTVEIHKMN